MFDQHAVDERIRLEQLHNEVLGNNWENNHHFISVPTNQQIQISESIYHQIPQHKEQLEKWGL